MRVVRRLQPYLEIARGVAVDAWPFRSNTVWLPREPAAAQRSWSSEFAKAFSESERSATGQPAAYAPSYGWRAMAAILLAGLLIVVAMTSFAGASPTSAAGALLVVYVCGYLVGSLLVERLDEEPVLTWAVIRTVVGLLLSAIGFLLSLVLSLPWFLVPVALVAAAVHLRGWRAFSWPHVVVRFRWDGVAAGILAVILLSPMTISVFYMAPGSFPPVFYNVDVPYFLEKVHALVAANAYPPESLSNLGGRPMYHFATHAMAALVSRGSGLLPHHSVFLIVFPLLTVGVVAAAIAVAHHVSKALPRSIAVPLMLIPVGLIPESGQNVGGDFLILGSIAAVAVAPSRGWTLPAFLIGIAMVVKTSTGVALFAGFILAEAWQAWRANQFRPSPQMLVASAVFVGTYAAFFVATSAESDYHVELFPLWYLRLFEGGGQVAPFVTNLLWLSLPVLVVSGSRIGDLEARSTPLLLWSIAPFIVVNATRMVDARPNATDGRDWAQVLAPMPFLLDAFALSFASRRWPLLGYRRRAAFLLTIALAIVPVLNVAARHSVLLLSNPESGNEFADNQSLAEALTVIPTKDTLIVTNDLRYPAEDFRRVRRQMQIPALFGHQAFAVNYIYEKYSFSSERYDLQELLLEQPEWRDAISEAARKYHWTHLLIRKDYVHPDPIPLERLFENQFYAVFRFP